MTADADDDRRHEVRDLLGRVERAAVEAELETGRREATAEQARRHVLFRAGRVTAGLVVTAVGVVLLALPGPGLLMVAAGLAILSRDVPFAERLLVRVSARLPADADGRVPRHLVAGGIGVSALAVGGSLWWTLLR